MPPGETSLDHASWHPLRMWTVVGLAELQSGGTSLPISVGDMATVSPRIFVGPSACGAILEESGFVIHFLSIIHTYLIQ